MNAVLPVLVWGLLCWHGGLHPWQQALAALLLAVFIWRQRGSIPSWRDFGPTERALACLLLAAGCGIAVSMRPQETLNAVAGLGLGFTAALLIRRQPGDSARRLATVLMVGGAVLAAAFLVAMLWGWAAGDPEFTLAVFAARHFSPNQNLLAGGLVVPALLLGLARLGDARGPLLTAKLCVAVATLALVCAGSRGAVLALAAGSFWLWARWKGERRRLTFWMASVAAALAALTLWAPFSRLAMRVRWQSTPGQADVNYYRRADFWKGAAKLSLQRPFLGHGLGAFAAASNALDLPTALTHKDPVSRYRLSLDHAHNEWLELAVETGWPITLGLALCALAWMLRRRRSSRGDPDGVALEAGVLAAAALSMVDMNLRTPGLAWGLILCFCAVEPGPESGPSAGARVGARLAPAWALVAVLCLGGAAMVHSFGGDRDAGGPGLFETECALWLQPLDAAAASQAQDLGLKPWPWSAWAGRQDPAWWWKEALRATDRGEQEADARQAVALRPYFAPGWYWLGLKLAQDGEAAEASRAMDRALALEPNFCRVLAWQADQARAQGDQAGAKALTDRIRTIGALSMESPEPYSHYIQSLDPALPQSPAGAKP